MTAPRIKAEVTFLSEADGGRRNPPIIDDSGTYRPHLVIEAPSERTSPLGRGRELREDQYLGVKFFGESESVPAGTIVIVTIELTFPSVSYDDLIVGATFTIREGTKIVGFGKVLSL